jgi:hypothetical protein
VLWRLLDHKELVNHKPSSFFVFFAERVKVMLLCGSDVLKWLSTPGAWVPQQVSWIFNMYLLYHWWPLPVLGFKIPSWYFDFRCQSLYWCLHNRGSTHGFFHLYTDGMSMEVQTESICEDYGIICVTRDGSNTRKLIFENDFLYEHRVWWSLPLSSMCLDLWIACSLVCFWWEVQLSLASCSGMDAFVRKV